MELTLFEFHYRCKNCNNEFDVLDLPPEGTYGEFIMYGQNGEIAYWNGITDPVFKEVSKFTNSLTPLADLDEIAQSSAFLEICGVCCDLAREGSVFRVRPSCPDCKSEDIRLLREIDPQHGIVVDVPCITHNTWNRLSQEEKKQQLLKALKEINM